MIKEDTTECYFLIAGEQGIEAMFPIEASSGNFCTCNDIFWRSLLVQGDWWASLSHAKILEKLTERHFIAQHDKAYQFYGERSCIGALPSGLQCWKTRKRVVTKSFQFITIFEIISQIQ